MYSIAAFGHATPTGFETTNECSSLEISSLIRRILITRILDDGDFE
jgi:hypothetical protein